MPYYKEHMRAAIRRMIDQVKENVYTRLCTLSAEAFVTAEPLPYEARMQGTHKTLQIGEKWGELWDCAWFRFTGEIPASARGADLVALIDVNGEGCVFDETGCPVKGLTCVETTFDTNLGFAGKRVYRLPAPMRETGRVDLWVDCGCNDLFGNYKGGGTLREAYLAVCNEPARQLVYDLQVLYDLMECLEEGCARRERLLFVLYDCANSLRTFSEQEIAAARERLAPELAKRGGDASLRFTAVGHAHIDLAWLWPLRETVRKGARTFSTAIELMDRYPDYIFGASQPQLYDWMRQYYPALYEKIKQKVKEGRWEPQGAMWVEPDVNLSGGESLVRQIYYGKKFYQEEFGLDVRNLWLPDVFGYNAALPQILKKSGVDYFMTQKLSWSEHNAFPHQSFRWRGIDGTEIVTHMLPEETYNGPATPASIRKAEYNYHDKGVCEEALLLFGIGDGGGGPSAEHLERLRREKDLAGLCPVEQGWAAAFFERLHAVSERLPVWSGELYLEKHQGTLTTQARSKWFNRKMEAALRELEFASTLTGDFAGYPEQELEAIWKEVLLYQFHDILPGSSIKRVYDESLARYELLLERVQQLIKEAYSRHLRALAAPENTMMIYNSLSWDRREWITLDGKPCRITLPALGWKAASAAEPDQPKLHAQENALENVFLRVEFAPDGSLLTVYDKVFDREALRKDMPGNRLEVYDDSGDCWDIPITYQDKAPERFALTGAKAYVNGCQAIMEQRYVYGGSVLTQKVILGADKRVLVFETEVDWKEDHKMLRTAFDVGVQSQAASYDIQYGQIKRPTHTNTTWDMARFEVCGIKWADLSQNDYGVALQSDCKYGYRVLGSRMELGLLRSPDYPGKGADRCRHRFTYALYPHAGNEAEGDVARQAYEFVYTPQVAYAPSDGETADQIPEAGSLLEVYGDVIVESVKKAWREDAVVVRLYEPKGQNESATVTFCLPFAEAVLCDLMEENEQPACSGDDTVSLELAPFEIVTLKFYLSRPKGD